MKWSALLTLLALMLPVSVRGEALPVVVANGPGACVIEASSRQSTILFEPHQYAPTPAERFTPHEWIHGQRLFVDPGSKLVLVPTALRTDPTGNPGDVELAALSRALAAQAGSAVAAP